MTFIQRGQMKCEQQEVTKYIWSVTVNMFIRGGYKYSEMSMD